MAKFYITKWALSGGIIEYEQDEPDNGRLSYKRANWRFAASIGGEGKQWHRTLEEAKKASEQMRVKKIASLKNQIAKLEKLEF